MTAGYFLMSSLEVSKIDGLHLIEIYDSAPLALGLPEPAIQAFELSIQ